MTRILPAGRRLPRDLSKLPARQLGLPSAPARTPTTCATCSAGRDAHSHAHAHARPAHCALAPALSWAASRTRSRPLGLSRFRAPQQLRGESAEPFPPHAVLVLAPDPEPPRLPRWKCGLCAVQCAPGRQRGRSHGGGGRARAQARAAGRSSPGASGRTRSRSRLLGGPGMLRSRPGSPAPAPIYQLPGGSSVAEVVAGSLETGCPGFPPRGCGECAGLRGRRAGGGSPPGDANPEGSTAGSAGAEQGCGEGADRSRTPPPHPGVRG